MENWAHLIVRGCLNCVSDGHAEWRAGFELIFDPVTGFMMVNVGHSDAAYSRVLCMVTEC